MKRLLFTHNTNISNGLNMLSGVFKNIRCCNDDGSPIGLGAQFRHGLDSQYGEIKFIMNPNFEKNKKGFRVNEDRTVDKVEKPYYLDFYSGEFSGEILNQRLDEEYKKFRKRPSKRLRPKYKSQLSPRDKKIIQNIVQQLNIKDFESLNPYQQCKMIEDTIETPKIFMDKCIAYQKDLLYERTPYGEACRSDSEKQYSWCNIQLHLAENVPFTDVKAVLLPKYLLFMKDITVDNLSLPEFLKEVNEKKYRKGKMNPFYHKLHFIGTKDYDKYYSYISPKLFQEDEYYKYLYKLNQRDLKNKKVKDFKLLQDYKNALKDGTRATYASSSLISSTRRQFNQEVKVYLDIVNDLLT